MLDGDSNSIPTLQELRANANGLNSLEQRVMIDYISKGYASFKASSNVASSDKMLYMYGYGHLTKLEEEPEALKHS